MTNDIGFTNEWIETILDTGRFTVYEGGFAYDDGKKTIRTWITPGNVVAVLPFDDEGFWLARQPREVIGRNVLSLCAGKIDPGEIPFEAAARELREELGLVGGEWSQIASFYSSEGITDEHTTMFAVQDPAADPAPIIDVAERITIEKHSFDNLDEMIDNATNAKLLIGLHWLRSRRVHEVLSDIMISVGDLRDQQLATLALLDDLGA